MMTSSLFYINIYICHICLNRNYSKTHSQIFTILIYLNNTVVAIIQFSNFIENLILQFLYRDLQVLQNFVLKNQSQALFLHYINNTQNLLFVTSQNTFQCRKISCVNSSQTLVISSKVLAQQILISAKRLNWKVEAM